MGYKKALLPVGVLDVGQEWPTYQQNQQAVASQITWGLADAAGCDFAHPPRPEPRPNETLG
ncbi:hypothetical protein RISK_001298 [Rhodopirellula islandica]|uniref:Uncharacterized protein n=1 Tax=Rhodopirellula islandica TaxID=595434 RepID=A0A0J1EMH9_RHOIS|nr:hypothetical protein RISK_001298 [Rhodopirellula islandica]